MTGKLITLYGESSIETAPRSRVVEKKVLSEIKSNGHKNVLHLEDKQETVLHLIKMSLWKL